MCACTEPDGSGIGAVYVKCGGQMWPINMLTHTYFGIHTNRYMISKQPTLVGDPIIRGVCSL